MAAKLYNALIIRALLLLTGLPSKVLVGSLVMFVEMLATPPELAVVRMTEKPMEIVLLAAINCPAFMVSVFCNPPAGLSVTVQRVLLTETPVGPPDIFTVVRVLSKLNE